MERIKHVVCPQCLSVNRVPAERLADKPSCGKCGSSLLPGAVMHLDKAGLERWVEKSEVPILVDFWADWCGPCKMMAPAFQEAAAQLAAQVVAAKVNTEEEKSLALRYGIQSIPTLVLFNHGRDVARVSGALPAAKIVEWVRERI